MDKGERHGGKHLIRNSTAEFLIFTGQSGDGIIEADLENVEFEIADMLAEVTG